MVDMFDRIDCIGKSVLGLSIQCAQCHTHKFDPITMDEYYGMFAFRDPHGIRPLCFGVRHTEQGDEYAVVSESVVLDSLGFELIRDLALLCT